MKSRTLCGCVIALLLISTFAFGEIKRDGDWDGHDSLGSWTSTTTLSEAGSNPYGVNSVGQGWEFTWTTVYEENLEWSCKVYVWAEVQFTLWNYEDCEGFALARATMEYPGGSTSYEAKVDEFYEGDGGEELSPYDGVYELYKSGNAEFQANEGIYCYHDAYAAASVNIPYGGDSHVRSHSDATAWGTLR